MSLSPSIATSINLSPDTSLNGPRLYLDVIHGTGELNTISLSGSGGLSETSSVRAHFQAGGHNGLVMKIVKHPVLPVFISIDSDREMILWRTNSGLFEQLGKYKLKVSKSKFKWLSIPCKNHNRLFCLAIMEEGMKRTLVLMKVTKPKDRQAQTSNKFMRCGGGSYAFDVLLTRQISIRASGY